MFIGGQLKRAGRTLWNANFSCFSLDNTRLIVTETLWAIIERQKNWKTNWSAIKGYTFFSGVM